jgi:hypothetical protein
MSSPDRNSATDACATILRGFAIAMKININLKIYGCWIGKGFGLTILNSRNEMTLFTQL